jgi:hypothetical protein
MMSMKKLTMLFCVFCLYLNVYAQDSTGVKKNFKISVGSLLGTKTKSEGQGYSGSANNLYNLSLAYSINFDNRFQASIGPRIDYFSELLYNDQNAYLASLFLEGQINFVETPKTLFLYGSYGMGPKFGNSFYAGNRFEVGLGWQYQPKFLGKKTAGFTIGYNGTKLKHVYAERHTSDDGINVKTTSGYYRLSLKSVALNISLSF